MKESAKLCILSAVTFIILSLVTWEVAGYPMMESVPNNGPYSAPPAPLQPNPDPNVKDIQLAQNAYDTRQGQFFRDNPFNRMRLYLLNWLQNSGYPMERLRTKKTCLINAGLSHACDYKDTLDAIHEGLYLGSDQTPGRK